MSRVQELLEADEEEFAADVAEIDRRLRREIRERQEHRRRIAKLAAGDSLVLPEQVVDYLDQMRARGIPEPLVEGERDGWILMAARWPEKIPEFMTDKLAQLDLIDTFATESHPLVVRLQELMAERGWSGWSRMERTADGHRDTAS